MVWTLLEAGEEVVVVDRLSTGFEWAVAPEAKLCRRRYRRQGSASPGSSADYDVDAIIHFAGSIVVPESVADPLSYYENNTANSRTLIAAAVETGVRAFHLLVHRRGLRLGRRRAGREDQPQNPDSPYGMSKLMTEIILRDVAKAHDFAYTALRYFNVAGADPKGRTGQSTRGATHLIKVACETALGKRESIEVFGTDYPTPDGTCIRDYIHVTDLANAHLLALKRLREGGESIVANCGYGRGYSVLEVLDCVQKVTGQPLPIRYGPRRAGDAVAIVANADKARAEFGWTPRHDDLTEIVASALAWERSLSRRNSLAQSSGK
jgi:UDP-glucose 4-epimerase